MATSYNPYYSGGWQSGEEGGTPITPDALNHMDTGIADAFDYTTQSTADVIRTGDVVNNLTSTATDKPLSAAQGKALSEAIAQSTAKVTGTIGTHEYTSSTIDNVKTLFKANDIVYINLEIRGNNGVTFPINTELFSIPSAFIPSANVRLPALMHHKTIDVWVSYFVTVTSTGRITQDWTSSCDGISISSFYML